MAEDAPIEIVKVIVQEREIVLDPKNMKYNENSIGEYMNKEYGWVDYLGKQLEYAQKEIDAINKIITMVEKIELMAYLSQR
jgi:hypothetical protein